MMTHTTTFPVPPKPRSRKYGNDWTSPENMVSNGAYVLTEHTPQRAAGHGERNPNYWDDDNVIIDTIVAPRHQRREPAR